MDAVSFVLGVKSAQLRSSQLRDLVYRGRRLGKTAEDGDAEEGVSDEDDEDGEDRGEGSAKKAWVLAVYHDLNNKEHRFQRT
jgi:structural maintenance of chromosome 1